MIDTIPLFNTNRNTNVIIIIAISFFLQYIIYLFYIVVCKFLKKKKIYLVLGFISVALGSVGIFLPFSTPHLLGN